MNMYNITSMGMVNKYIPIYYLLVVCSYLYLHEVYFIRLETFKNDNLKFLLKKKMKKLPKLHKN